jgi:hypothetical protein
MRLSEGPVERSSEVQDWKDEVWHMLLNILREAERNLRSLWQKGQAR